MNDDRSVWNQAPPAGPPWAASPNVPASPSSSSWVAPDQPPAAPTAMPRPPLADEPVPFSAPFAPPFGPPTSPPPTPRTGPPTARRGGIGRVAVGAISVVALVGTGWIGRDLLVEDPATVAAPAASSAPTVVFPAALDGDEPVAAVAAAVAPAVVKIETTQGLGSGVIYDASGLLLSNAHVVGSAKTVTVVFADGSSTPGEVLGVDNLTDVAVVRITPPEDLTVATMADASPAVGQMAIALGSPFGLEQTVTSGVVSAVGRPVNNPQGAVVEMLQTDAPINPGNSGGALANRSGQIIGINTLIFSENGENNGIGFAIPIQTALDVAERIVKGETLERGFLGVSTQSQTNGSIGVVVASVEPGSAAASAGLRRGDVIVSVDGEAMKGAAELAGRIQRHQPGDVIRLEIDRDGDTTTVDVTLDRLGG